MENSHQKCHSLYYKIKTRFYHFIMYRLLCVLVCVFIDVEQLPYNIYIYIYKTT